MTALDDFGFPRLVNAQTGEIVRTNYAHVEERLRPLLDAFQEEAGFEPGKALRARWIAGARRYADICGTSPELLRQAIEHMRRVGLNVFSPDSCTKVAFSLKPKHYEESQAVRDAIKRQVYLAPEDRTPVEELRKLYEEDT